MLASTGFQTIEKGTKHKGWENAACSDRLIELAFHYHSPVEVFSTPVTDNLCPYLGKSECDRILKLGARFLGRNQEIERSEKVQHYLSDESADVNVVDILLTESRNRK